MEDINGLTSEELREFILEQLDEVGITPGMVEIKVLKGPKLLLIEGKVDSEGKRDLIIQTIQDSTGINNIINEMIVAEDESEDYAENNRHEDYELYDEDNEYVGSEDVSRAVEDGVPYVPPTEPPLAEPIEDQERKRKRRKKK